MCDFKTTSVLAGDSIFDSGPYNKAGASVIELLTAKSRNHYFAQLIAVDGDVTNDVEKQLTKYNGAVDKLFISCGGNDALQNADILNMHCSTVHEAMTLFAKILKGFRSDYKNMLKVAKKRTNNVTVCTIYNQVPGIDEATKTALALFNEVILEEAFIHDVAVIDLRILCDEHDDYAPISPIEPSGQGGDKIATSIHDLSMLYQRISSTPIYSTLKDAQN
ncbi:MAG: hypothetical protein ACJA0T_000965 [Colwellia sp.]|jgi:hypothetical protein